MITTLGFLPHAHIRQVKKNRKPKTNFGIIDTVVLLCLINIDLAEESWSVHFKQKIAVLSDFPLGSKDRTCLLGGSVIQLFYMEELFAVYPGNPYPSTLPSRNLQIGEFLVRPSKEGELLLGPVIVFRNTVMLVPGIGIDFRNRNRFP